MKTFAMTAAAAVFTAGLAQASTIAEIASGDDRFETLVAAAAAAGLVETLSSEGPFTVFAPTDDAFAALPEGTVEGLLKPEAKDDLTNILLYHVLSGAVPSTALSDGTIGADTVAGAKLCVTKDGMAVMLTDGTGAMANVIIADIEASNGVIHVIDKVVLPGDDATC